MHLQGSARVIRCLQDNRSKLAPKCKAALFDHEVRMSESIELNKPMAQARALQRVHV
jgi:golgi apparatus protein 1